MFFDLYIINYHNCGVHIIIIINFHVLKLKNKNGENNLIFACVKQKL